MKTTPINHTGGGYKPEPYKKVRNKIKKAIGKIWSKIKSLFTPKKQ